MRPPVFVIGAQKGGTTTLTMDLMKCAGAFVDLDLKESSLLLTPNHPGWERDFSTQFKKCGPDQRPVDISTRYSMAPDHLVDPRNVRSWGDESTVIYVVRDRLERSVSHHHHDTILGLTQAPIDVAIQLDSAFVRNSLYATQVEHWLTCVTPEQLHIVRFESYVANRRRTVAELCRLAEVESTGFEGIDETQRFNQTAGRPTPAGLVKRATQSRGYRSIRRRIPIRYRQLGRNLLSPRAPDRVDGPSAAIRELVQPVFEADEVRLRELLPSESFVGF